MKPRDLLALILLGALWGGSFLFIRMAAPVLGPFVLMELRVAIAAVVLTLYAVAVARLPKLRSRWKEFLVIGTVNAAIPFSLIAVAEINLTASLGAILNATTALFTAVVAPVWIGEALTARQILGLFLGVVGVTVLVGWDPIPLNGIVLLSVGAVLAASLSYAIAGVYAKRNFPGEPPLAMATGTQAGAAVILLPLAAATLPGETPSPTVGLSVLALALLSTALAYLLYFRLIANVGPTKTSTVTFLVPAFGLLFGVLFLGEPFGVGTLVGFGIILFSVALVTGVRFGRVSVSHPYERPSPRGWRRTLILWGFVPIPFFKAFGMAVEEDRNDRRRDNGASNTGAKEADDAMSHPREEVGRCYGCGVLGSQRSKTAGK